MINDKTDTLTVSEIIPFGAPPEREMHAKETLRHQLGIRIVDHLHELGLERRYVIGIKYFEEVINTNPYEHRLVGFKTHVTAVQEQYTSMGTAYMHTPPTQKYTSLIIADHIDTVRRVIWENRIDASKAVVLNTKGWKIDSRATKQVKPIPVKLLALAEENRLDSSNIYIETRIPYNVIRYIQDEIEK